MTTSDKPANIYQRINLIMKEVEYVKKDASVQGYKAVTHDQVTSVVRGPMVKHGVVLRLEQTASEIIERRDPEKGIKMHLYGGTYNAHFVNIENPQDVATVTISAHAADNGDKAPGKCASYATKYAMLKMFCLETGEDDESRSELRDMISDNQQNELASLIDGDNRLWQSLCKAYNIKHLNQISNKKFDEVKKRINDYKARQNGNNN
ncbi:MAG: ERF family protein [Rickettsiales bacterium]